MKDSEIIVGLLRKVAARMRVARLLHETGFAVCVVLFALAVFELVRAPLDVALSDVHLAVLVIALAGFCLLVLLRASRRVPMAQAASLVDARLPLHDELKSAYWFVSRQPDAADAGAAFVRAHVANAAQTAQQLKSARVLPLGLPRSLLLAIVPALALAAAMSGSPVLVRAGALPDKAAQAASESQSARALLSATATDEEEILQLDKALATFESSSSTPQQRQEALIEARDAVDQLNMQAAVTREGLAKLARAMRAQPGLEQVAEAIEQGRTQDAIAMLQQLGQELGAAGGEDADSGQQDSAPSSRAEMPLGQEIGDTARDLATMTGKMNEESVNRLLDNLEQAQDTMTRQQRANAARSRMDELREMVGLTQQHSDLAPTQFTNQGETPMGAPSPDTGNSDLRGATMFRQAATMPGESDQDDDGSTTGGPSGHAAARALEGRATRRLDAQLKLEKVQLSNEAGADKDDESSWFYAASQQEGAESGFADVRARDKYSSADVMRAGRVPIQQRQAVREYFINIHEGSEDE